MADSSTHWDSNAKLTFGVITVASFISGAALVWGLNNQELTATRQDNRAMRLELESMQKINSEYHKIYMERFGEIERSIEKLQYKLDSIGVRKASFVPVAYEF